MDLQGFVGEPPAMGGTNVPGLGSWLRESDAATGHIAITDDPPGTIMPHRCNRKLSPLRQSVDTLLWLSQGGGRTDGKS